MKVDLDHHESTMEEGEMKADPDEHRIKVDEFPQDWEEVAKDEEEDGGHLEDDNHGDEEDDGHLEDDHHGDEVEEDGHLEVDHHGDEGEVDGYLEDDGDDAGEGPPLPPPSEPPIPAHLEGLPKPPDVPRGPILVPPRPPGRPTSSILALVFIALLIQITVGLSWNALRFV